MDTIKELMLAEVQCDQCKEKKWVGYNLRHNGRKKPPPESGGSLLTVRCSRCPEGRDFTTWTGQVKYRGA